MENKDKNIHDGHRERLRQKLLSSDEDAVLEHEMLEVMLFYAIPRRNTNTLSHRLIEAFGSVRRVLEADSFELMKVRGVGSSTAQYLELIGRLSRMYAKHGDKSVIYSFGEKNTSVYLRETFPNIEREQVYMLYLDGRFMIKRRELVFEGSFENVDIDIGSIARRALGFSHSYCVCVHNHPSGLAKSSMADRETTAVIRDTLKMLGIVLYDSVIVTESEQYSILYNKHIPTERV